MFVFLYKMKVMFTRNDGSKGFDYITCKSNKLLDQNYVIVKALIDFLETIDEKKWFFNGIEFLGIEIEKEG